MRFDWSPSFRRMTDVLMIGRRSGLPRSLSDGLCDVMTTPMPAGVAAAELIGRRDDEARMRTNGQASFEVSRASVRNETDPPFRPDRRRAGATGSAFRSKMAASSYTVGGGESVGQNQIIH